jgi:hypothetical protein
MLERDLFDRDDIRLMLERDADRRRDEAARHQAALHEELIRRGLAPTLKVPYAWLAARFGTEGK